MILLRRRRIVALAFLTTIVVAGGVLLSVPSRYDAIATASIDPGDIDPISETYDVAGSSTIALKQGNMISLVASERAWRSTS